MLVIGVVLLGLGRSETYRSASRARQTVILVVILFPLLLLFNLLWPPG